MANPHPHPQTSALQTSLRTRHLTPSASWLSTFLARQSTTSLAALASTATYRLLASDITQTFAKTDTKPDLRSPTLPPNLSSPALAATSLSQAQGDVVLQVLDVLDIARSKAALLEDLEMGLRGEAKGQGHGSVVRVVEDLDGDGDDHDGGPVVGTGTGAGAGGASSMMKGVWKILLQDARGALIWAFDGAGLLLFSPVPTASTSSTATTSAGSGAGAGYSGTQISIGTKLLLKRGCRVARGVVLLERDFVVVLGGRIEALEKAWAEGQVERLRSALAQRED